MEAGNRKSYIQGLKLAGSFYEEAVSPVLEQYFPNLEYTAGLIGSGSEVLGYDTVMSSDHHWGPRCMLFLSQKDISIIGPEIKERMRWELPLEFMGYPVNFAEPDPEDHGTQLLVNVDKHPVNHRVEVSTIEDYLDWYMGLGSRSVSSFSITHAEWLSLSQQKLRTIICGELFHDDLGFSKIRDYLKWYPDDVWRYLLAAGWYRIAQEEHLMGRAGYVGDELGSALIGSRLVRDVMRLAFYMEKQYPPYAKWFGTGFAQLHAASTLTPLLRKAMVSDSWEQREKYLCEAFEWCARRHNELCLTDPLSPTVSHFFGRPFKVISAERFTRALIESIDDQHLSTYFPERLYGSIDLISDSTDILSNPGLLKNFTGLYPG